ncbi:MAG: hypothetical protein J6Y60_01255 [Treponema sp.]|nr:hypothetical protein [Treponema sp.]
MNKKIINITSLILVATISFISHYIEVLANGWGGLQWVRLSYWTFILLPLVFCIWLKLVAVKTLSVKQAVLFLISYAVSFILIFIHLYLIYNKRLSFGLSLLPFIIIPYSGESIPVFMAIVYGTLLAENILVIFGVFFGENMILAKLFNLKFPKRFKVLIFFLPAFFFLAAWALLTVLYFLRIFPLMNLVDLKDSIFIFKTGTIIFSTVLGEGLLILYGRKDASFIDQNH